MVGTRSNRLAEAVLTTTHNRYFGSKIRKNRYSPENLFCYIKVGYTFHGHVFPMVGYFCFTGGYNIVPSAVAAKISATCSVLIYLQHQENMSVKCIPP